MLLSTYNEDPHRIMARCGAIYRVGRETGCGSQFDWYVLSDTTTRRSGSRRKCFLQLRRELVPGQFYSSPPEIARKSGNIEDWVDGSGSGYDH